MLNRLPVLVASMVVAGVAAMPMACSSTPKAERGAGATGSTAAPLPGILGSEWRCLELRDASGAPVPITGEPPTLRMDRDGRASGFAGVNRYFSEATIGNAASGGSQPLRFGPVGATRMGGPPERMQLERAFTSMLERVRSARVVADKSRGALLVLEDGGAGGWCARFALDQQSGDGASAAPDAAPDAEATRRVMEAAEPGAQHAWLHDDNGRWKGTARSWPSANAEPFVATSEFTIRSILGGRFSETSYRSEMPDMPVFEGLAITGYDNAAREFQGSWIDSYGTTMMTGNGQRSADGATLSMTYTYFCPIRQRRTTLWQSITRESRDRQVHRMWAEELASGERYLMMEAVYERQPG